jgi:hypothetical protein
MNASIQSPDILPNRLRDLHRFFDVLREQGRTPFAGDDTSAGMEYELQVAVEGEPRDVDLPTTVVCAILSLTTGISWYTAQLMPDVLVPLMVMSLWLLGFRRRQLGRAEPFGLAAIALLGNAFICGALSNPHDRYQSRTVWLATLIVAMAAARWWQLPAGKRNLKTF